MASLIVQGDWVTHTNAVNAYLVENEATWQMTYVLPLLVVNFGSDKPVPFPPAAAPFRMKIMDIEAQEEKEDAKKGI